MENECAVKIGEMVFDIKQQSSLFSVVINFRDFQT